MDPGLTIRPTANVAETAYVRVETPPVRAAVQTTLPPSASVTATPDASRGTAYDPGRNPPSGQRTTREVVLDPQTRELIYRVIDERSGQVERQVPEAALLRLRAYIRAAERGESPFETDVSTDRAV
jgi:hypothetical protein